MKKLEIYGLELPFIEKSFDLAEGIINAVREIGIDIDNGDVIVVTSKIMLKSKGLLIDLKSIKPSLKAKIINKLTGKDPIETEIILRNSEKVYAIIPTGFLKEHLDKISKDVKSAEEALRSVKALMIVKMKNGIIASDVGLDYSNVPPGYAIVANHDFDHMAKELRNRIKSICGKDVAVIVADTEVFLSNGKVGSIDIAVGSSGIDPLAREFGERDLYGRPKFGGMDILVDEICAAAALLMKQTSERIPVVLIKGLHYKKSDLGVKDVLITKYGSEAKRFLLKTLLLNIILKMFRIL